jgi:hypothetical protein
MLREIINAVAQDNHSRIIPIHSDMDSFVLKCRSLCTESVNANLFPPNARPVAQHL